MPDLEIHTDAIAEIASRLDLREPNREALVTIDAEISQHFDVDEKTDPFEAVLDVATGVGKTYVMVAAMELLAETRGVRDFVVITPGTAILNKTRDNFTAGHAKSMTAALSFDPVLITAENFASPSMRASMDDPEQVKVYLFSVQSLLRPTSKQGKKVHKFQEGLGDEFYAHLQKAENLVVFADEHHAYFGPVFSRAVRDLGAWLLLGLTATPHKQTPKDQIIYRYPLAAAIADRLVKTPVIVGRKDDRSDPLTKLSDGVALLDAKQGAVASYRAATDAPEINPVMLVVASTIDEANEYGELLRGDDFQNGRFTDAVLVVTSDSPDEAIAALSTVEDTNSPVRVIISVGMLKEGWDVKNVYVIASMRASVSDILTEQTLGRGMRLPFGKYTDIEMLDTLEVVAHERYQELLKRAGILQEAFVDYRTRAVLRKNMKGKQVSVIENTTVDAQPIIAPAQPDNQEGVPESAAPAAADASPAPRVTTVEDRTAQVGDATLRMKHALHMLEGVPSITIPQLKMTPVESPFSLKDITDLGPFTLLGHSLATNPDDEFSRVLISAQVVTGSDGVRTTRIVTTTGADKLHSSTMLFPADELQSQLTQLVLSSSAVPARKKEVAAMQPLLDAFLGGLGEKAQSVLSANLGRAGARLISLIETEQRKFASTPKYEYVVDLKPFSPVRITDREISAARHTTFVRSVAYSGWKRCMYELAWFDSSTERAAANIVDDDDAVSWWTRLHINDIPILWNENGQKYNPDLLVVETDGTQWIVETKMNKEMESLDVQGKKEAAQRWVNYVNADEAVAPTKWRYLLLSESAVGAAHGSWSALKSLGA